MNRKQHWAIDLYQAIGIARMVSELNEKINSTNGSNMLNIMIP